MNRVDLLSNAILDTPIVLINFMNIYKKHKRESIETSYLYCFYEGQDDSKYYNFRVSNINTNHKKVSHLNCDGKDKLLELHKEIERRKKSTVAYKNAQILYFIDKDFDDLIKKDKLDELEKIESLYITPTYSIENFYTSLEAFREILKSEFHLVETEDNFEKLTDLFADRQSEFHQILLDVNSWIATQKYFLDNKEKRNVPYSDLRIVKEKTKGIVKITLEKIHSDEDNIIEFLENEFQESFKMEEREVSEKFQELKDKLSQNPQGNFRGKFELEFLNKFLKKLAEQSNQKDGLGLSFIGIHEKIKVTLTPSDTISDLSQYADTPRCLKLFIQKF